MSEVIVWTLVFMVGDFAIIVGLITFATRKDKEKARLAAHK